MTTAETRHRPDRITSRNRAEQRVVTAALATAAIGATAACGIISTTSFGPHKEPIIITCPAGTRPIASDQLSFSDGTRVDGMRPTPYVNVHCTSGTSIQRPEITIGGTCPQTPPPGMATFILEVTGDRWRFKGDTPQQPTVADLDYNRRQIIFNGTSGAVDEGQLQMTQNPC